MKNLNVGLIGCNKRALWYGAFAGAIDPLAYARLDPFAYHHMVYYRHVEMQVPIAQGLNIVKIYDDSADAAARTAAAFRKSPEVCRRLDDVSRGVDLVFIANETGDGGDHRRLATPGLERGTPTFIDRPFAASASDARALIALAKRKRAPLLSCSHMRLLPQAAQLKARFPEIVLLDQGIVIGRGPAPALIADGVELALFLFGDEFDGRVESVQSMGTWPLEIVHLHYVRPRSKRDLRVVVVNSHAGEARNTFWATASSFRCPVDSGNLDMFAQTMGGVEVLKALRRMVATGKPPIPCETMIETVAVMEAARLSHNRPAPAAVVHRR